MGPIEENVEREVHLRDYLDIIIRRKWLLISFFVVVVISVMIRTFSIKPVFQASCQVLIERESPKIVKIEEVLALDARWGDEYYETQYEILKSNLIAQRVIDELNLADHPEFISERNQMDISPTKAVAGVKSGTKNIVVNSAPKGNQNTQGDARLIHNYLSRLSISPIRDSRLVNVQFEGYDPELVAGIANTHAKNYIEHSWERKLTTTQDAVRWLKEQIKEVRKKLEGSEDELQSYRKNNDLVSLDFGERHNIIIEKLSDLNNVLTRAKTARIEQENLYEEFKNILNNPSLGESIPIVLNNPLIQELKAQNVKLEGEYSELSHKYGPEHPRMIRLRSQIGDIEQKILRETENISRSVNTEYRVAMAKEKSLQKALAEQKKEALGLNKKEIQYKMLKRDVETNRSMYESLLKRLNEATLDEDLEVTNINIVAPAVVPNHPAKPNKSRSLMLAIVIGLLGGVGLVFSFEYFDSSIKSSEDIERQIGQVFLGLVESIEHDNSDSNQRRLVTIHDQESTVTDEFRTISTNILYSIPNKENKVILITSSLPQEGKTFLSTNLAVLLARIGKRVLLVDADMRNPAVHTTFGIDKSPGLSDLLAQGESVALSSRSTQVKDLTIIPAGTSTPNPAELLMSKRMSGLLDDIRQEYDCIIIDTPPVTMLSDSLNLAPLADGVVLVVKSCATPRTTIQQALKQLKQLNVKLIGAVLNNHNIRLESYYHRYYYSKYYHGYYRKTGKGERTAEV